jgi:hypothetical protein
VAATAEDLSFDLLAGSLRADSRDNAAFLDVLAGKLEAALPGRVRVHRAGGLLRRSHPVDELTVDLGEDRFTLRAPSPGRLEASQGRVVRGVVLRSAAADLPQWIDELTRALLAEAARSEAARQALEGMLD